MKRTFRSMSMALEERCGSVVNTLLPGGNVHLLIGASRIGKTTWLLQQLYEWDTNQTMLGFTGNSCKWAYINCTQTIRAVSETLNRLGLIKWQAPIFTISELENLSNELSIETILDHPLFTDTKFFIIEGLEMLLPEDSSILQDSEAEASEEQTRKYLMKWMLKLRQRCTDTGITILTSMYPNEQSQALTSCVSTLICIDNLVDSEHKILDNTRKLSISPRTSKAIELLYVLDEHGKFFLPSF